MEWIIQAIWIEEIRRHCIVFLEHFLQWFGATCHRHRYLMQCLIGGVVEASTIASTGLGSGSASGICRRRGRELGCGYGRITTGHWTRCCCFQILAITTTISVRGQWSLLAGQEGNAIVAFIHRKWIIVRLTSKIAQIQIWLKYKITHNSLLLLLYFI